MTLRIGVALCVLLAPSAYAETFRAGFARRVITPALGQRPVYLAGFGYGRTAEGVHDDLYARAVALSDARRTVALVSVDLVGLFLEHTEEARKLLAARMGGRPVSLLLASTHNHAGPDTLGLWGPTAFQSGLDPEYRQRVLTEVAAAAAEAVEGLADARLLLARAKTPGLIEDGRLPRVIDDELVAAQAVARDGRTLGTIVNWSSHPEALGRNNRKITADYPATLVIRMEFALGGTCVFFSGAIGGLMTPLGVKLADEAGLPIAGETIDHARAIGERAAATAIAALGKAVASSSSAVEYRSRRVFVPLANQRFRLATAIRVLERPLFTGGKRDRKTRPDVSSGLPVLLPVGADIETEVSYVRAGDLEILGVPGEIYPELVLGGVPDPQETGTDFPGARREPPLAGLLTAPFRMVFGLANDEIGYIIPASQWDERPPFAYGRDQAQYGEVNSVGPAAAPALARAFRELVSRAAPR